MDTSRSNEKPEGPKKDAARRSADAAVPLQFRVPRAFKEALKQAAKETGRSVGALARELMGCDDLDVDATKP